MEGGDGGDLRPFWVDQTTTNACRRRASAAFLNSGLVVFLLLVTAVLLLTLAVPVPVPSAVSLSAQIVRPSSVKRSWDSLNAFLVLAAVAFGFLNRNRGEERYADGGFQDSPSRTDEVQKISTPGGWYKFDRAGAEGRNGKFSFSTSGRWSEGSGYAAELLRKNSSLTRNSSSYPDLREFSLTSWAYGDDSGHGRRHFDDIEVDTGRVWVSDLGQAEGRGRLHRRHRSLEGLEHLRAPAGNNKTVIIDTLMMRGDEDSRLVGTVAAAAHGTEQNPARRGGLKAGLKQDLEGLGPMTARRSPAKEPPRFVANPEETYGRGARRKEGAVARKRNKDMEGKGMIATPPPQAPLSPPPSPPRQKNSKSDRKGGGAATGNPTKDFLNSLYQRRKRKQRQRSIDNLDTLIHVPHDPVSFEIPSPSPPPQPSVFQNMFSTKKQKRKKTITVTLAPQQTSPTPPLLPSAVAREPEPTSQAPPSTTHKSPKPAKMNTIDTLEEISNSGGESPLNRILQPPALPPPVFLKTPAWKFVVQGDYVRVNSITSSRSESPDTDDGESDVTPSAIDAGGTASFHQSPLFCPSPDVNTKAESFITNFRAKLKLEKIHSMKKREMGLSGLGPGPRRTRNK